MIIDFIIIISKLKNLIIKKKYDIILIIVDRLTKYFYIILFKEKYISKKLEIIIFEKFI